MRAGTWKTENEGLSECHGRHDWGKSFVGDGLNWGMDTEYRKCQNCHAYRWRSLCTKKVKAWRHCPRCNGTGRLPTVRMVRPCTRAKGTP